MLKINMRLAATATFILLMFAMPSVHTESVHAEPLVVYYNEGLENNRVTRPGNVEQITRLLTQLEHGTAAERTCAATDLGGFRSRRSDLILPLGLALKNDESKWVRRAAAKSLGKLGTRTAIPLLRDALNDSDKWVAHTAENALRLLGKDSI